ncbi:hypothetical protein SISNIDRAFT_470353 [Sistotremastrum niveocremeum HHB9708]|uniref:Uncharacterized protein n=1 Tax=Sistotremastrum niveocremeum HHB9708 TaxID=1314777 RepID=A0A164NZ75_9AGAM|nr:hypothetical protein SISNIDRAFT_470353 [Sistotremastrum niveocremeum HHB9708]
MTRFLHERLRYGAQLLSCNTNLVYVLQLLRVFDLYLRQGSLDRVSCLAKSRRARRPLIFLQRFRDRCFGSPGRRDWAKTAKSNRAQIQSPTSSLPSTLNGIDPHLFTPLARLNLSTSLNALLIDELHLDYVGLRSAESQARLVWSIRQNGLFLIILEYIFRVCKSQKERAEIVGKQISRVEWFLDAVDEDWQRTDLKKMGTSRGYGRGAGA